MTTPLQHNRLTVNDRYAQPELRTEQNDRLVAIGQPYEGDVARRLAACWNFCADIPTAELTAHDLPSWVSRQAFLTGMQPSEEGMTMGLKGVAAQMLAAGFAGQFKGSGAINYLEVMLAHAETGPMVVTIQRREGKTPGQLRAEAEDQLGTARITIQHLEAQTREQQRHIRQQSERHAAETKHLRGQLEALTSSVADGIGMQARTLTVRYDLGSAATEPLLRAKLIELGWTPPAK